MTWSVEGTYIEACNCEAACPCIFLSPPTEGECSVLIGWHIDKGRHGDAVLDGLNAALIAFAPGNMKDGQWKVALYLDSRGDDKQKAALQGIFSGADGGHIANLVPLIGQVLGARPAKISFSESANRQFRFEVDGAASTEIEAIQGRRRRNDRNQGSAARDIAGTACDRIPLFTPQDRRFRDQMRCRRAKWLFRRHSHTKTDGSLAASSRDLIFERRWTALGIWALALGGWLVLLWGAAK